MLTLKLIPGATVALGLAVVVAGCAAGTDDGTEPLPAEETSDSPAQLSEDMTSAADDDEVNAAESENGETESVSQAIRRGGVYRGGAYRGGAYRGGGYRRGTFRGGAVYGTGGVVYGAGGVYRAGRYRAAGGVWVTCDGFGSCW